MKSRHLGARLPALATTLFVLIGLASALDAGPAAAQTTPTEFGRPSDCGCKPAFTIEKRQEIAGSGSGFTTAPLTGVIGQTVDYEIIVENTGKFPETFGEFIDLHCDAGTLAGGPGGSAVAPGESTTYTCNHLLAAGRYTNEATVTGFSFVGVPVTHTSNQVVVEVPSPKPPSPNGSNQIEVTVPKAPSSTVTPSVQRPTQMVAGVCEASPPVLRGASGPKSGTFTAQVNAAGIKQITFYLDGRRLKTLRSGQARHGLYSITIHPRTLAYGQHKLSIRTLPADVNCAAAARNGVFVRPRPQQSVARFAG